MLETGRRFEDRIVSKPHKDIIDSLAELGNTTDIDLVLDMGLALGINFSDLVSDPRDSVFLVDTITAPKRPYSLELALESYSLHTDGFSAERANQLENLRNSWIDAYLNNPLNFRRNLTQTDTPVALAYREAYNSYLNEP